MAGSRQGHSPGLRGAASVLGVCLFANPAAAADSRLYPPDKDHADALRVAQAVSLATREEILSLGMHLEILQAAGLGEAELTDGSLAVGRVNCCHESTEQGSAIWFYVPPDLKVQAGDLVIVRMGRKPSRKSPGTINVAVEIRETADTAQSKCIWDPPNDRLWLRIIYCDWMPAEGWTLEPGLWKTWLKRPDAPGQT